MGMSLKATNQDETRVPRSDKPTPRSRPSEDPEARRPTEQAIWWSLHKVRHIATRLRVKFRCEIFEDTCFEKKPSFVSSRFPGSVCYYIYRYTSNANKYNRTRIQELQNIWHYMMHPIYTYYLAPQTSTLKWFFQSDDSKPLRMGNGHFTKDSLKKWLFRVPVYLQRNNTEKN